MGPARHLGAGKLEARSRCWGGVCLSVLGEKVVCSRTAAFKHVAHMSVG